MTTITPPPDRSAIADSSSGAAIPDPRTTTGPTGVRMAAAGIRRAAVAGTFYPADPATLRRLVDELLAAARTMPGVIADDGRMAGEPLGILVPHAGLAFSGFVAAAGWSRLATDDARPLVVVILGTDHAGQGRGSIAAWPEGAWADPLGDVAVDEPLAAAIAGLGDPFIGAHIPHLGEHSIEVQLPLLAAIAPTARIVPLGVAAGTGEHAIAAGTRLGTLLAARRTAGERIVLAIASDMAHYPPAGVCDRATAALLPSIAALDPAALALAEAELRLSALPGLVCGMCGIEPAVTGLAALRAMGAATITPLAAATSADAGADPGRTVGYLALRIDD